MLAKIITKKLNYRIIDYLVDKVGIVTSIAKAIKSKKANVSKALRELEGEGIVVKDIIGRSHSYSFNYSHPEAKEIIKFVLMNRANELSTKLDNLPKFMDAYLRLTLKGNYLGLIVFGSALTGNYKDIDIFVILNKLENKDKVIESVKLINNKISPIVGTKKELRKGAINQDALYKNIIGGVPFGCLDFIFNPRYGVFFLKREDIEERFIIGYREIQSCRRFKDDKIYLKNHLKKGIFDIIYALLNYKNIIARNDKEAEQFFKKIFKCRVPTTIKQAELFAERMKKVIFY